MRHQPLIGLLTDRAGVEDQEVGILRGDRLPHAQRLQEALDPLGVVHVAVLLAPEGRDVVEFMHMWVHWLGVSG